MSSETWAALLIAIGVIDLALVLLLSHRWARLGLVLVLPLTGVAIVVGFLQTIDLGVIAPPSAVVPTSQLTLAQLLRLVKEAPKAKTLPADLVPPLSDVNPGDDPIPASSACWPGYIQSQVPRCVFGDLHGAETMILVGDSHAAMWFQAIDAIAKHSHWRLVLLTKASCPVEILPIPYPPGIGPSGARWEACSAWRRFVAARINHLRPELLIVSQRYAPWFHFSESEWRQGLERFYGRVKSSRAALVVLGSIDDHLGPTCLPMHSDDVQACSFPPGRLPSDTAERQAAQTLGGRYVDVLPWFCARTCPQIIDKHVVYLDEYHITDDYSLLLEGVLAQALDLPMR